MTGIVEVPLSVAHQMKNIEATEAAKKQLLNASDDKAFGYTLPWTILKNFRSEQKLP